MFDRTEAEKEGDYVCKFRCSSEIEVKWRLLFFDFLRCKVTFRHIGPLCCCLWLTKENQPDFTVWVNWEEIWYVWFVNIGCEQIYLQVN